MCTACDNDRECAAVGVIRDVKASQSDLRITPRELRFKAYRLAARLGLTTWTRGLREPLPTCVDIAIKAAFPDPRNRYTHFRLPRTGKAMKFGTYAQRWVV